METEEKKSTERINGNGVRLTDFWYVVAETEELQRNKVLGRQVLGRPLAVFRDAAGKAAVLEDRCIHRNAPLSCGAVRGGGLQCSYHGWVYDRCGKVVDIPSLGPDQGKIGTRSAPAFAVREQDGYVYARLSPEPLERFEPFKMPHAGEKGWKSVRVVNRFQNTVTNCAENFVDIPHTAFVHYGIFRKPAGERLEAGVERRGGSVLVTYRGERANLGTFSRLLNPSGGEIGHTDSFHMPNVTSVEYRFGPRRSFCITSQSVPVTDEETLVYTDLSYDYGIFNPVAGYFVRREGQKVIDQDIEILALQMKTIKRFGTKFTHTPADVIHVFIESIRTELAAGRDPRTLPDQKKEIEFWV